MTGDGSRRNSTSPSTRFHIQRSIPSFLLLTKENELIRFLLLTAAEWNTKDKSCQNQVKIVAGHVLLLIETFSWKTANRKMSRDRGLAVTFAVCSSRLNARKGF